MQGAETKRTPDVCGPSDAQKRQNRRHSHVIGFTAFELPEQTWLPKKIYVFHTLEQIQYALYTRRTHGFGICSLAQLFLYSAIQLFRYILKCNPTSLTLWQFSELQTLATLDFISNSGTCDGAGGWWYRCHCGCFNRTDQKSNGIFHVVSHWCLPGGHEPVAEASPLPAFAGFLYGVS